MTYQQTLNTIKELTHYLNTHPTLTREQTKELIIQRELIWTSYLKN